MTASPFNWTLPDLPPSLPGRTPGRIRQKTADAAVSNSDLSSGGTNTKMRDQEIKWVDGRQCALLSDVILVFDLTGCATTPTTASAHRTATWSPGEPDALTSENYELAVEAIGKRAKTDAPAALNLLRDGVLRLQTNVPTMMAALALLYRVSNAVGTADWEKARTGILELRASYGPL